MAGSRVSVKQSGIHARSVSGRDTNNIFNAPPLVNPGLAELVRKCLDEIERNDLTESFFSDLSFFSERPDLRSLREKFAAAGVSDAAYEAAIWEKENFEKFFEVIARHSTGQQILVAAFRHAYSIYKGKVFPHISDMTFMEQQELFESEVVLFLSHNLTGLPYFYGRSESIGLIYYLADNCFIEYAHV